MTGNFAVDDGTLERLAERLRKGASDLDASAGGMPNAPDAGASTRAVTGAMAEIARAVIGLNQTMAEIADKVVQGHGDYREVDQASSSEFQNLKPH